MELFEVEQPQTPDDILGPIYPARVVKKAKKASPLHVWDGKVKYKNIDLLKTL